MYMYACMGIYIHIKVAISLFRVTAPKKVRFWRTGGFVCAKLIVWKEWFKIWVREGKLEYRVGCRFRDGTVLELGKGKLYFKVWEGKLE